MSVVFLLLNVIVDWLTEEYRTERFHTGAVMGSASSTGLCQEVVDLDGLFLNYKSGECATNLDQRYLRI